MDDYYDGKYPGLSEAIQHCYDRNMGVLEVFFHFSELLSGHERAAVDHTFSDYGDTPPFRYDDCRILVTGLPSQVYHDVFGWCQPDAMAFLVQDYMPFADALLARCGFQGISLLYLFDGRKRIVTIFSPAGGAGGDALAMAEELNGYVQRQYQAKLLHGNTEFCNFTALSGPVTCFEEIAPTFARLRELADCSFFKMEPAVVTPERLEDWRVSVDAVSLAEAFRTLQNAIFASDLTSTQNTLNDIFLVQLKRGFNFRRLEDAMSACKNIFRTCQLIYGAELGEALDQLCDYRRYASIEACCRSIFRCAAHLCRSIGSGDGHTLGRITREAVYFIRTHYAENIYLATIAEYVNVVPTYLSSVFKRETGETVNNYLIGVRMERARELLACGSLKIAEVSHAVGIQNTRYFSACFKKSVGMSPNDYRAAHSIVTKSAQFAPP